VRLVVDQQDVHLLGSGGSHAEPGTAQRPTKYEAI